MMDALEQRELLEDAHEVLQRLGKAIGMLDKVIEVELDVLREETVEWERFLDDHPELGEEDGDDR